MAKDKKQINLYEFLEQSGILETGDEALIKKARTAYWRDYHKNYKRERRASEKEFLVTLNHAEQALMTAEAGKHGQSVSHLLKEAAFAYMHKAYLPLPSNELVQIQLLLSSCYDCLERNKDAIKAIEAILNIEEMLRELAAKPLDLEDAIRAAIAEHPQYLNTLEKLIKEYDH
jgi:hypothetical protein